MPNPKACPVCCSDSARSRSCGSRCHPQPNAKHCQRVSGILRLPLRQWACVHGRGRTSRKPQEGCCRTKALPAAHPGIRRHALACGSTPALPLAAIEPGAKPKTRVNASAPFGLSNHLNLRKGNLTELSTNVPQSAPNSQSAGLTPDWFGDTLAANESSFWLGRISGRHPVFRSCALPCIAMSDRSGWSARCPTGFRNHVLQTSRSASVCARTGCRDTVGGCLPTLDEEEHRDQPQHRNPVRYPRRKPAPAGRWLERHHRPARRLDRDRRRSQRCGPRASRSSPTTSICCATDTPS